MIDKQIYQIGLTMINGVGDVLARHLLEAIGDAEAVFTERPNALAKIPGIGRTIVSEIKKADTLLKAEKELDFVRKNGISIHFLTDSAYPIRLRECPDAPILFYFKGNTDLNASRVISVVGTRRPSDYGLELTERLVRELAEYFPDLLVISGLAYGIDVCAHRNALRYGLPTVAVLAHGMDRLYPSMHRQVAVDMLTQGGLLTDFPAGTNPDRPNFISRNRIVAGLADASVVVESAEKGGSLITADMAFSYGRDVYTFPGRVTDPCSKGCNELIRQNKAGLITCATDLVSAMRWDVTQKTDELPTQAQLLFPQNQEEDSPILSLLKEQREMHINELSISLNLPVSQLSTLLFELEMEGRIKSMPGSVYKLATPL